MRTNQKRVRHLLSDMRKRLGVAEISDVWRHISNLKSYIERRIPELAESCFIIGPYKDDGWTAYWVSSVKPGIIAQYTETLDPADIISKSEKIIEQLKQRIARRAEYEKIRGPAIAEYDKINFSEKALKYGNRIHHPARP